MAKILKNIKLTCTPLTIRTTQITWNDLPASYFAGHTVTLEVAEASQKTWLLVTTLTAGQAPFFNDTGANRTFYNKDALYYRIVVSDVGVSPAYKVGHPASLYAAEMIRRHMIRLKEGHEGVLMYLFGKKNRAERCPDCWDEMRQQRSRHDCPTCKGTGFVGGYYDPVPIYVNVSPEQVSVDVPLSGSTLSAQMSGWAPGLPLMNVGDILVDPETRYVWDVKQLQVNTHKRVITKQDIVITRENDDTTKLTLANQVPAEPERTVARHGQIVF